MTIVATSRIRAYQRVADGLRQMLEDSAHAADKRLPTEAQLMLHYGVSRQTVRRAFQDLEAEGLVYRVPGRGTFAIPRVHDGRYLRSFGAIDDIIASSSDTVMQMLEPLHPIDDPQISAALGLADGERVEQVRFLRTFEGEAFCYVVASFPGPIADRLRRAAPEGPGPTGTYIGMVERVVDHQVVGAHQEIAAIACPRELASLIGTKPKDPILAITRIYYDVTGRFVEHTVSSYSPERYTYRLDLRRSHNDRSEV